MIDKHESGGLGEGRGWKAELHLLFPTNCLLLPHDGPASVTGLIASQITKNESDIY